MEDKISSVAESTPSVVQITDPSWTGWVRRFRSRLMASPLARRAFAGSIWSLAGAVGGKFFTLIASIYVARVLGKEVFGEFGIVQSTLDSFSMFAGLGLGVTAVKFVAELRETNPARAGRVIALSRRVALVTGSITAGLVFIFADKLAAGVMAAPSLASAVRIASIVLLLGAINGAQKGTLFGFEAFQTIAKITLIGGIASFLFMVVGVRSARLMGAIWALVGTMGLLCVLNHFALKGETKKYAIDTRIPGAWSEWRVLSSFSLPAVLSGLSVLPVNWACNLILVNQPNGYAEMGLLNAAVQWRNIILFVPSVLMSVVLPMLANLGANGEYQKQRKLLVANVAVAAAIGFGIAIGVALLSSLIMGSFGAGFESGRNILILQAFAAAIAATVGVLGQFLIGLGEMWWLIALQLVWAFIYLGMTWHFRANGGEGVSLAYLVAYVVHLGTMSGFTCWKLKQLSKLTKIKPLLNQERKGQSI